MPVIFETITARKRKVKTRKTIVSLGLIIPFQPLEQKESEITSVGNILVKFNKA